MSTQSLDYAAIIADLEAKKAAIEATIASLRSAMALGTLGAGQGGDVPDVWIIFGFGERWERFRLARSSARVSQKLHVSIWKIVKRKQTSREIADALLKGGIESTSNNFVSIVHAILDRARKSPNPTIVKLGTQWGLSGWYPKGILNNVAAANPSKEEG